MVLVALVPLVLAGLVLMNTGMGRSRSAAHSIVSAMAAISTAVLVYCLAGFSWVGVAGGPVHTLMIGGRPWDWLAAAPFFLRGVTSAGLLTVLLQAFAVSVCALIPVSAGADRWRLSASCLSTVLLAGWVYPLFAHWASGGGWLAHMGFLDPGGAGAIHVVGGLTALNIVWILGPRRGKYSGDESAPAIPGHNIVYVLFGALLLLPGWIVLNIAEATLFAATGTAPMTIDQMPLIAINTLLAAASGSLTALLMTRLRFGKPDASLSANGWVSGLVASSALCAFVNPMSAILVGLVAGGLSTASVELLEMRMQVDDPGGAISVHAVAGLWGLLAVGLFTRGHLLSQVVGISTLAGVVLPTSYALNWLLNRILTQRTNREGDRLGMDLHELGAGAYPDFMIHNDEFINR